MRKKIALYVLVLAVSLLSSQVIADEQQWIKGRWIHTYDPDGDVQDILTFGQDGRFMTKEVLTGRELEGKYYLMDGVIKINLYVDGQLFVILEMTHDEKKDRLYFTSKNTGNTAYYTKMSQ